MSIAPPEDMPEDLYGLRWEPDREAWFYRCDPCWVRVERTGGVWVLTLSLGRDASAREVRGVSGYEFRQLVCMIVDVVATVGPTMETAERLRSKQRDFLAALAHMEQAQQHIASAASDLRRQR